MDTNVKTGSFHGQHGFARKSDGYHDSASAEYGTVIFSPDSSPSSSFYCLSSEVIPDLPN